MKETLSGVSPSLSIAEVCRANCENLTSNQPPFVGDLLSFLDTAGLLIAVRKNASGEKSGDG